MLPRLDPAVLGLSSLPGASSPCREGNFVRALVWSFKCSFTWSEVGKITFNFPMSLLVEGDLFALMLWSRAGKVAHASNSLKLL